MTAVMLLTELPNSIHAKRADVIAVLSCEQIFKPLETVDRSWLPDKGKAPDDTPSRNATTDLRHSSAAPRVDQYPVAISIAALPIFRPRFIGWGPKVVRLNSSRMTISSVRRALRHVERTREPRLAKGPTAVRAW